jgi:hypothetical protein
MDGSFFTGLALDFWAFVWYDIEKWGSVPFVDSSYFEVTLL